MNLLLFRHTKEITYTIGRLYFNSIHIGTIEPPVRQLLDINNDGDFNDEGEGKIYGNTAIPEGRYKIKMQYSPTFKRMMPYLQNVKGFKSIMIHPGNSVSDTRGCILVGENTIQGRLVNSRAWSDLLNSKITAAENNGEDVWIEIND